MSVHKFEEMCGMSNGYISSMRKGLGSGKLNNVLNKFPELNREWLLYGEGEMLRNQNVEQTVRGDNNTAVAGNANTVNSSPAIEMVINEIAEMRKLVQKRDEQIDRLLAIIEKLSKQ